MSDIVKDVVNALLARHQDVVPIDAIGDAIGARAIDMEQIDRIIGELEAAGRQVTAPGGTGVATLKLVIPAARALAAELKRTPKISEIAARSGAAESDVRQALLLAKVMQRR